MNMLARTHLKTKKQQRSFCILYVHLNFLVYNLQDHYVTLLSILFLLLAQEANSTIAPLLYSMWPSLRGAGYQAD